jgi:hypothetical protein
VNKAHHSAAGLALTVRAGDSRKTGCPSRVFMTPSSCSSRPMYTSAMRTIFNDDMARLVSRFDTALHFYMLTSRSLQPVP